MNNTIRNVERLYHSEERKLFIERAKQATISDYTKTAYADCKSALGNMSLETFAARTANFNPGKAGIGQQVQMDYLRKNKFHKIEALSPSGQSAIFLYDNAGVLALREGIKSNINGVKSFDAIEETAKTIRLFVLKTVDVSSYSDNIGGGHQKNVEIELTTMIEAIGSNSLSFKKKPVEIYILLDGKSASPMITRLKANLRPNATNLTVSSCDLV
jgi:hypothetical protein